MSGHLTDVDLENVDWKGAQVGERRVARSEIVQRLRVAEMLEAVLREVPDSGLTHERAMRRDVRRVVRSLKRSPRQN